ncbi:unnamed protein product [Fusarium graminearum]|uniref:Chromosome 3, complete genome n=1 Tax=Gibberella zeae (strain ATCC MYA-4620 / CBS 123657 / FGSC 9075 / NRRL 31084 / PH-1) TaxID=229533 RepID=A0A098DYR1_GIBZE|nr:unnamed protein product [Fusarium graminearum]CZS85121.1 unnamed protein product [Fusarium graminearum]
MSMITCGSLFREREKQPISFGLGVFRTSQLGSYRTTSTSLSSKWYTSYAILLSRLQRQTNKKIPQK